MQKCTLYEPTQDLVYVRPSSGFVINVQVLCHRCRRKAVFCYELVFFLDEYSSVKGILI